MIKIPSQYNTFKYLRPIEWEEVFSIWRKGEEHQEGWREHWEERGFDSWQQWRKNYSAPISPENLQWYLFEISDPLREFPLIYGTPTRGWIAKCYGGEITKQLNLILDSPIVADNKKIKDIIRKFPEETMFTGLVHEGKIVLVEGMHRACALAIMSRDNQDLKSRITIALAEFKGDIPKLGKGDNK